MGEKTPNLNVLYMPRTGEDIDKYVDVLSNAPEHPLTKQQKNDVFEFSEGLMHGDVSLGDKVVTATKLREPETLEDIEKNYKYSKDKHEISIDYFLQKEGRDLLTEKGLADTFGLKGYVDANSLRLVFRRVSLILPNAVIKELADTSKKVIDSQIAQSIVGGTQMQPPERVIVFSDATNFTKQLSGLLAYKDFYQHISRTLQGAEQSDVSMAKKSIVGMYLKQINGEIASLYPDMFAYIDQIRALDGVQKNIRLQSLHHIAPNLVPLDKDFDMARRARFFIRLDRIRNGASIRNGERSAVNPELEEFLDHQNYEVNEPSIFTEKELEILDGIKLNAYQMKSFAEEVMTELGMLSEYSTDQFEYSPDRPTRAPDGKWQVIVRDEVESMTADDPQGGFEIPTSFNRTLTKATAPVGVIPGLAHELQHCFQQDNIRESSFGNGIGRRLFGRRNDAYFEAGAVGVERVIQERMFGRTREDSPHYLRALVALEDGATEIEAIKVFYESYKQANPKEQDLAAAKVAVSRVMRLARRFGGFNSQPLNYSESGLLLQKTAGLHSDIKSMLFDSGAFELDDITTLHKYDLLPKQTKSFPYDDFIAIVTPKLKKLIKEYTS